MKKRTIWILILFLLFFGRLTLNLVTFCSSYCTASVGTCTGKTKVDCSTCSVTLFTMAPNSIGFPLDPCRLVSQTQYIASELPVNSMNVSTYTTSNSSTITCGGYQMSGQYVDYDFIGKNFTGITTNHYQLVIRFSIGYIGTWSATQNMNLQIQHQYASYNNSWAYSCASTEFLCSGTGLDCFQNKQFIVSHNNTYLNLNFTTLYLQSDPTHQYWGIRDLIIIARLCHSSCSTCIGSSSTQCTSCATGFYLNGNACVAVCPALYIPSLKQCTTSCPVKYFKNSITNFCQPCMSGCLFCMTSTLCAAWQNQNQNPQNTFKDFLGIWVALIILGTMAIAVILFKIIVYVKKPPIKKVKLQQVSQQITHPNDQQATDENIRQKFEGIDIHGFKGRSKSTRVEFKKRDLIESFGNNFNGK